jgi:hypothetical protein
MAIRILPDSIKIGPYTLSETSTGFRFDGGVRTFGNLNSNYFGGTVAGFTTGGYPGGPTLDYSRLLRFPFATDSNSSDVATFGTFNNAAGQSSSTHGYASGGNPGGVGDYGAQSSIRKFSFSSYASTNPVGSLTVARRNLAGQSSASKGYSSGGGTNPADGTSAVIDSFPFSSDTNASNVGSLTVARKWVMGSQSSPTHGYTSGGFVFGTAAVNTIDRFPFAAGGNATDVGDLLTQGYYSSGQSSGDSGYVSGGRGNYIASITNVVQKFPFSTNANATDVGDLTGGKNLHAGQSSTNSGYTTGGNIGPPGAINIIDKFPFATNANATDVGDLNAIIGRISGHQD